MERHRRSENQGKGRLAIQGAVAGVMLVGLMVAGFAIFMDHQSKHLVRSLDAPTYVAHRGGPERFPEGSMEAYKAAAAAGFPIEMDIRALRDGTLVVLHDADVQRTMTGVSGDVSDVTSAEWAGATVNPPGVGEAGTPATWEQILETFAGEIVIVPEMKIAGSALDRFIESIISKDMEGSVVVQSFDVESCQRMAAAGLTVLYLIGGEEPEAEALVQEGFSFVGPSKEVDASYVSELQQAGLKVWPYTINTMVEAAEQFDKGVDGIFTDDPWELSSS